LDRIDLFLNIAQTEANKLLSAHVDCLNISDIKRRIEQARQLQAERYKNLPYKFNARLTGPQVRQYLTLNSKCEKLLTQACQRLKLSNRALFKVIKVAQTLADLDNSATIKCTHIQESLSYRHREF
jgi:magnesium chelatase family protein